MHMVEESGSIQVEVLSNGLVGELFEPEEPRAVVLFAHGERARRLEPHNRRCAQALVKAGFAVFAFDLLEQTDAKDPIKPFEIDRLTDRFLEAIRWIKTHPDLCRLHIGLMAIHTGAAAAIRAAAIEHGNVQAIVCRGGRPDLAGERAAECDVPVLYLVPGNDKRLVALNCIALLGLGGERRLEIIEGATHFFQEPGALEAVMFLAENWFSQHLAPVNPKPLSVQ